MKVYLIECSVDYEFTEINGVYTDRGAAEYAASIISKNKSVSAYDDVEVVEHELIEEVK